ncbi:MAG: ribonuclease R [Bacilli bacterium]|nr:ribonuclease R [Bacilli bacterium]
MDMEQNILDIIKSSDKALSVYELYDALALNNVDDLKSLLKTLNRMEDNLKVYRTKKDNYMLFSNSHLKIGTMIGNKKGFGFVNVDDSNIDIFVAPSNMNNAIDKDRVIVEVINEKGDEIEGKVVRIVDRNLDIMVGEYIQGKNGKGTIKLDNDKLKIEIEIDKEASINAIEGHKVLVKVGKKLRGNEYKGHVIKILGHKTDPGVDILSIAAKYDIEEEFPEAVLEEVEKIPDHVLEHEYEGRRDLREEIIFTIDGADTKDIDDAISIEKLENNNYKLGVHIADVSYYIRENTEIDKDAYLRGTSVYLADRVIPMLPRQLSNGICSLNPDVDRLAMSCVMEIDEKGKVVDYEIFESVIKSKKQMTYTNVNKILEENIIPEGYEEFVDKLKLMGDCAKRLRKAKIKNGYIDFEIEEAKLIVDDKGEVTEVTLRDRGTGEKLIEDFMVAANETVASHIYYMELPFVYRVHGIPSEEKIQNFLKFVGVLGHRVNGKIKDLTPIAMQNLLEQLKDVKEYHILSAQLLRCMQKAIYDKVNIGHFGLGSQCYTHFTSPIRRYPDTTVHRLLRTYLFNHSMDKDTLEYWDNKLVFLTEHSSERERAAADCEREVDDMKIAEYMEKHIGEEYEGMINSVLNFGMFVELPNLIEGLVKVDSLKDDRYIYDETTFSLVGQSSKRRYRLGDKVKVKCVAASKEMKTVDFEIIHEFSKDKEE